MAIAAAAMVVVAAAPAKRPTPNDIVEAAPHSAWKAIDPDQLMIVDLANGGRFVVQLAPAFAPVHVANIQALARFGFWQGAGVYRVQDNYVAQWGNGEVEKSWPKGVVVRPPAEYRRALNGLRITPLGFPDAYAPNAGFADGWPVAYSAKAGWASLTHCYGTVGVARGLHPDTGTGSELYAVIGHAPRQLDRNIALVGRVIEGIERLSSLTRGTGNLGFYDKKGQNVGIGAVRLASEIPIAARPSFEAMDTASPSFAAYLRVRANRNDDFYRQPAGGVDVCNVQVPVRRAR